MEANKLMEKLEEEGVLAKLQENDLDINCEPCFNNTHRTIARALMEIIEQAENPVDLIGRLWSAEHFLEEEINDYVYETYPEAKVEFDKQFD